MKGATVLKAGALVFLDVLHTPLIPCKVLRVYTEEFGSTGAWVVADIKTTAARPGYARGEIVRGVSVRHVLPRGAVYVRGGQFRIARYTWELNNNAE